MDIDDSVRMLYVQAYASEDALIEFSYSTHLDEWLDDNAALYKAAEMQKIVNECISFEFV